MNLRIVGVTIGTLSLCICCARPGVQASNRSSGRIVATGQMIAARFDHAAVLLQTGHVLEARGRF